MKRHIYYVLYSLCILLLAVYVASLVPPRLIRPAAYADALYYSPAFVQEMAGGWDVQWQDLPVFVPADTTGTYLNIAHNRRRTTNQPVSSVPTLYLFGNSTVYGSTVPDALTIASRLQLLLYAGPTLYRVENMGLLMGTALRESLYLKNGTSVNPGDMVIFYGGFSDALYGTSPQAYVETILQARVYVIARGAVFYHLLQPYIFTRPTSQVEKATLDASADARIPNAQIDIPLWYGAVQGLLGGEAWSTDLSHTLDSFRAEGHEIYLDMVHVNDQANAIIANAIAKYLCAKMVPCAPGGHLAQ